jgi:hypothetical protein
VYGTILAISSRVEGLRRLTRRGTGHTEGSGVMPLRSRPSQHTGMALQSTRMEGMGVLFLAPRDFRREVQQLCREGSYHAVAFLPRRPNRYHPLLTEGETQRHAAMCPSRTHEGRSWGHPWHEARLLVQQQHAAGP